MDDMFKYLDKSRVPTGYLLDYAIDLVDLFPYSGDELTDENYTDISIYQDVLSTIRSASLYEAPFGSPEEIIAEFENLPYVSVSIAAYKYNYIRSTALNNNLINYDEATGRVTDRFVNNNWINPYIENTVCCFAVNKTSVLSQSVSFRFPDIYRFTNLSISEIYFDPGDGNGYRLVSNSSPISVTYSTPGEKELCLQVYTEDGEYVCESHSKIVVYPENAPDVPTKGSRAPDDTLDFITEYNDGTVAKARMSYYCIPGNTHITKPFIVVEGFDPWIFSYMFGDVPQENVHLGFTNHTTFYDNWENSVLRNNYDLIYIDWDNSLADIRANAQLLEQIIERVNQMKRTSSSYEKNVVMGQSMGGLVARYALKNMEQNAKSHDVSTFISHDSPHWGANVPLGVLYFARQLLSFAHGFKAVTSIYDMFKSNVLTNAEQRFYSVLDAQSVKQMLVNYVGDSGLENSVHESWLQELNQYGFPELTENIAIVNGRNYDYRSVLGGTHLLYLNGYVKTPFWLDSIPLSSVVRFLLGLTTPINLLTVVPGALKVNIHAEVNPFSVSNVGGVMSKLDVWYEKQFLWMLPITFLLHSSTRNMPSNVLYYDEYPGSFFSLNMDYNVPPNDKIYYDSLGEYYLIHKMANRIMFIPTASALAINAHGGLTSSQYMRDYLNDPPIPEGETPFSAYMFTSNETSHVSSQEHIYIDNSAFSWIKNQLDSKIEGPKVITSSASYSLDGYGGPIQWKSSDTTKAVINDSGVLTAISDGDVTISAESYNNGRLFRKTKAVKIGFPEMAIKYRFVSGMGHVFDATPVDDEYADDINDLVQNGELCYEWSLLCDDEGLITSTGTSPTFSYLSKQDETVTVCLRLVNSSGNKGVTYSRALNLQNPFSVNYKYVEVSSFGTVRFV